MGVLTEGLSLKRDGVRGGMGGTYGSYIHT